MQKSELRNKKETFKSLFLVYPKFLIRKNTDCRNVATFHCGIQPRTKFKENVIGALGHLMIDGIKKI